MTQQTHLRDTFNAYRGGYSFPALTFDKSTIEPVTYNKYINAVGIEFEGFYSTMLYKYLLSNRDIISDVKNDGSLRVLDTFSNWSGETCSYEVEVTTKAIKTSDELNHILSFFHDMQQVRQYVVNETVGLHFHVSLKEKYYAMIVSPHFFARFRKAFSEAYPEMYTSRCFTKNTLRRHSYCKTHPSKNHYRLHSYDRYAMVNYVYPIHGTVEFRAYGGESATMAGLAHCIRMALQCIQDEIEWYQSKKNKEIKLSIADTKQAIEPIVINLEKDPENQAILYY